MIDPADHLRLLYSIARKMARRYRGVEEGDFIGWGYPGLVLAAKRFKPELGYKFSTFASRYIKGFMLTGKTTLHPVRLGTIASFKLSGRRIPEFSSLGPIDPARDEPDFADAIDAKEQAQKLMRCLKPRSRKVIIDRFWEGKTFEEIGGEMNLSRERIRQIEASALKQMFALQLLDERRCKPLRSSASSAVNN